MQSVILRLARIFPQSLIGEVLRIFGPEDAEKFVTIFSGTTLRVPSMKELEETERNLAIYETFKGSKSKAQSRRLGVAMCERYDISRREMRAAYKKTRKMLEEAKKFVETDKRTARHLSKKRKKKARRRRR